MSDQVSVVSNQSWGSRLVDSIKGVLIGLACFVGAFPLLWWNEGRAVQTYKSLKEGAGAVISVANNVVDAHNEGRLVHVSGKAITSQTLADPEFGIALNALHLYRKAEMYQWVEKVETKKRKKLGGGEQTVKTYKYNKDWRDQRIDSSEFEEPGGHQNPGSMPFVSKSWSADPVTLGAFTLSSRLVSRIDTQEPLVVTDAMIRPAAESEDPTPAKHRARHGSKGARAKHAHASSSTPAAPSAKLRQIANGAIYLGADPNSPVVGDERISFSKVLPAEVSIIAAQAGPSFAAYQTKAGDALELLQPGIKLPAAMFAQAERENETLTWILRLVGFVLMALGVGMVLRPLSVVADVLPILGDILGAGIFIVAVAVAVPGTLTTIAVAWLFYRPLLGVALLAAGVLVFLLIKKVTNRPQAKQMAQAKAA